ncbi:MAG TPA: ExeM/NucH family extracellular endonuclease [Vicinamibacterales bacterium]|nr:ExeM/NucH family extracellular endonuclease [Vicinamibacterales bacterium]
MIRSSAAKVAVLLGVIAIGPSFTSNPRGASVTVVISQVFGGGGNSGAPFTNDFVELHNLSDSPVSLTGWSLQYSSATGTGNLGANSGQLTELSGTIAPGGYFLVQEAGGANGLALPPPDLVDSTPIAMAAGAGKMALVDIATTLGCNGGSTPCPSDALAHIVDLVGYGNANFFEGTGAAPTLSNTTAAIRAHDGNTDTDDNSADFSAVTPNPRNSGFTPPPPPPSGCAAPASQQISAVQGPGTSTPFANQIVRVEGVVIGDFQAPGQLGGFYIQDDTPDADPLTSEGLFVFAGPALADVQAGQRVLVTGRAIEFNGLTELSSVSVVDVCGAGEIVPTVYHLPRPAGVTFEPFENMLVTFPDTLTATEHFELGRFGEVTVSSGGRLFQPTDRVNAGPAAIGRQDLNNRRRLLIDDGSNVQNPAVVPFVAPGNALRLGDSTSGVTGVLTFGFGAYRLEPTMPVEFTRTNQRPVSPPPVGGEIRVASFNTLNYFTTLASLNPDARGADTAQEFARQQAKEIAAIEGLGADVVALMEVENNGATAISSLVAALNAASGAGTYAFVNEPVLNAPNEFGGTFGSDAIKVALIYRADTVVPIGDVQSSADPSFSRPPLIQTFQRLGGSEPFTVAVNHFKSKNCGGDSGADSDQGDGQGCFNALRVTQAEALTSLLGSLGVPNALIVGDLNSYTEEDPIHTLEAAGYTGLSEIYVADEERYSFSFDGQSGELDHALAAPDLVDNVTGAAVWHINADEPLILDYNTEFNPPALYAPDAYRASDHDPIVVGLTLNDAPTVDAGGPYVAVEGGNVTLEAQGQDPQGDALAYDWDLDGDGEFETPGQSVTLSVAGVEAPAAHSVTVRVTDGGGLASTDSAIVSVVWSFTGFLRPVDNPPVRNRANAGSAIPLKFSLNGDQGLDILADGYPRSIASRCNASIVEDVIGQPSSSPSGLTYDASSDRYVFVWKTDRRWAGSCRHLILKLRDGTEHHAEFHFVK